LGYPEGCRRDKFYAASPNKEDKSSERGIGESGRAYPDFVFFSTANRSEHSSGTALVVVEVKKSGEDIEKHLDQARRYGDRLRSLFIVLTNGLNVKVLRRRAGGGEEKVEDILVTDFVDNNKCVKFYERMNFETISRIKELMAEDLQYEQLLQLDRVINADPELQEVLRAGDFKPYRAENEYGLIITRKKVSVSCMLPTGQEEGGVRITFSNPLRRNLAIHVPFVEFQRTMLANLHTPPQWDTRKFLRLLSNDLFEATLGSVATTLSGIEAIDLCECLDEVAELYKTRIIEEETLLETWNYKPARAWGERAYRLLTVSRPLWDLMKEFADEHDYDKGNSEWHDFIWNGVAIRVGRGATNHVILYPISDEGWRDHLPNGYIHVLYNIPSWMFRAYNDFSVLDRELWKQSVGPKGIWTASYTKNWLLKKFIPKVLEHYRRHPQVKSRVAFVYKDSSTTDWRPALPDIQDAQDLASYVQDVQGWLSGPSRSIAASLVRDYYTSFTNLIRNASLPADKYGYVWGNFSGMSCKTGNDEKGYSEFECDVARERDSGNMHEIVMQFLDEQVKRINAVEVENSSNAELLSRVFFWFLEMAKVTFTQQQINSAKAAISALWGHYQFEGRYIRSEIL
jgi:hypothetical protein